MSEINAIPDFSNAELGGIETEPASVREAVVERLRRMASPA